MSGFRLRLVLCVALAVAKREAGAFSVTSYQKAKKSSHALAMSSNGGDGNFDEVSSALARLDQQWAIQQKAKRGASRWTRLLLPPNEDEDVEQQDPTTPSPSDPSDFCWLLEPPNSARPSCVIVFVGGAGLGQFPHIAYNECLTRLADRLGAAVIAAPYQVGLDHFALAKETGERLRRAVAYCRNDNTATVQVSSETPIYCLTHSLGGKLMAIYLAATRQHEQLFGSNGGIGFMSFNNFSFSSTIALARTFADQLRNGGKDGVGVGFGDLFGNGSMPNPFASVFSSGSEELVDNVFKFAEAAVGAIGLDFEPNASDMSRLIQLRYDDDIKLRTRLFVFDDDKLDSSKEFIENCSGNGAAKLPSTSGLPGGHLTPVYFEFNVNDMDLPPDARMMAQEAAGGFESASFGDAKNLDKLVDELCNWILGKPPSREPQWEVARDGPPLIAPAANAEK